MSDCGTNSRQHLTGSGFLGSAASGRSPQVSPQLPIPPHVRLLSGATGLARDVQHPGNPSPLRHQSGSSASPGGAGILTGCPSRTPFGLRLGSPDPGRTNLPQETLGFRRAGFSPAFSLLIPGFSLLPRPALLPVRLHPTAARSPTTHCLRSKSAASVTGLVPIIVGARRRRPVSCYALFKWWLPLSQHPGCLSHRTSFVTEPVLGTLAGGLGCSPRVHAAYPT